MTLFISERIFFSNYVSEQQVQMKQPMSIKVASQYIIFSVVSFGNFLKAPSGEVHEKPSKSCLSNIVGPEQKHCKWFGLLLELQYYAFKYCWGWQRTARCKYDRWYNEVLGMICKKKIWTVIIIAIIILKQVEASGVTK